MPQVFAFIAKAWAAMSTAGKVWFVIKVVAFVASIAYSRHQAKKAARRNGLDSGRTFSVREPNYSRRIVYGQIRVGGVFCYIGTSGNKREFLHLVVAHAAHECESIDSLQLNDEVVPLDGAGDAVGKYAGHVRAKFHLGSPTQTADTDLVAETTDWTTDHRLQGICYSYVRLKYNSELFTSGIPNISVVIKGRKVYDPRTATTAYSDNAALCLRDYLLDANLGLGALASEIDEPSFIAAANICDERVDLKAGFDEARYTINGMIDSSVSPGSSIQDMIDAMAGFLPYISGKFRAIAGAHRTPVLNLTEDNARGPIGLLTGDPIRESFNGVKGEYTAAVNLWQVADYPPMTNASYTAQDGGVRVWHDLGLPLTTSAATAQRLAKIALERSRRDFTLNFPANLTALNCRAGDVISVTLPRFGFTNKLFEVTDFSFKAEGGEDDPVLGVDLVLRETDAAIWNWIAADDETTVLPAINPEIFDASIIPAPSMLTLSSSASVALEKTDGTITSRILVTWVPPADVFVTDGGVIEVQFKKSADSEWTALAPMPGANTFTFIDGVTDLTSYDVRVRAKSVMHVLSGWAQVNNHVIAARTTDGQGTTLLGDPSNLCYNPLFEEGDIGWAQSASWLIEDDAGEYGWGGRSTNGGYLINGYAVACRPGDRFHARARVNGADATVSVFFQDELGDDTSLIESSPAVGGGWETVEVIASAPLSTVVAKISVFANAANTYCDSVGMFRYDTFVPISAPSVSPGPQLFNTSLAITATTVAGTTARYTTDNSEVNSASPAFPGGGITITKTTLLRIRAFSDATLARSNEVIIPYTLNSVAMSAVATPTWSYTGTLGQGAITITLGCATPSATIKYTIDGGTETTYTAPFVLALDSTMLAWAERSGWFTSAPVSVENAYDKSGGR